MRDIKMELAILYRLVKVGTSGGPYHVLSRKVAFYPNNYDIRRSATTKNKERAIGLRPRPLYGWLLSSLMSKL